MKMATYQSMTKDELLKEKAKLEAAYKEYQARNLKLDMSRGKPGSEQLALSMPMLDILNSKSACVTAAGVDVRNYGMLDGIPEAKQLFADLLGVSSSEVIVMGSSSLR